MLNETQPLLQSTFTLRYARFSDLAPAARACTLAFWDDVLFGQLIHPNRYTYPADPDKYWYRRSLVDWWDRGHVFLVTTQTQEDGQELVTGFAHWSRIAPSLKENCAAGWGLPTWDPRLLLKPIMARVVGLLNIVSPNRACDPEEEQIIERSHDYLDHIWTGEREEAWNLENLAVSPLAQRNGQGRALVQWGLEQARKEGICASVISADGKERFYQRCGFDIGPVGRSGEGEGNPLRKVPGGLTFFRDKEGAQISVREPGPWMEGKGVWDWSTYSTDTKGG